MHFTSTNNDVTQRIVLVLGSYQNLQVVYISLSK